MAYGAAGFASAYYANRITYIIDENGIIRKVFPKVDVATHADDLVTYFATTPASA
jgi:peroxiredoxin